MLHHSRTRAPGGVRLALFGTASFLSLAVGAAAQGQPTGQQLAQAEPVEEVLITGSLIAGAQAVGVPVTALGSEDFVESGALTVTDVLRNVPALEVMMGPSASLGGGVLAFGINVQIHGLGTGAGVETLLMVNGLRWPPQNYSGDTVDPSIIPQIAVERVDVLTAGASAQYGSDATAGVINVIMKRGFDGATTQARFGMSPDLGNTTVQFSQLYGTTWDTGGITVSYEFQNERHINGAAREYFTTNFEPYGLMDRTLLGASVPGVVTTGNPTTSANAPGGPVPINAAFGTRFCDNCYSVPAGTGWNFGDQAPQSTVSWAALLNNRGVNNQRIGWHDGWLRPHQQSNRATLTFDQELVQDFFGLGDVSLFVDAFYSNRRGVALMIPPNGNAREHISPTNGYTVPTNNPYRPSGAPATVRIHYDIAPEIPQRTVGGELAGRYAAGFNIDNMPFDWTGKLTYSMSEDMNYGDSTGMVNQNALRAALGNTIASQAALGTIPGQAAYVKPGNIPFLNAFCDSTVYQCNSQQTLDYIAGFRTQRSHWKIQETGFNFSGPTFDLPGGTIMAAIAGQMLSHHYWFRETANSRNHSNALITANADYNKQRSYALFGELQVPIFGEDFTLPLVERFDLQLGYRYDKYNTIDDPIWTPKIAANWVLGYGLTLRGAWGKSFRAPSFAENSAVMTSLDPLNPPVGELQIGSPLNCVNPLGQPQGVALPGSVTSLLNPTCNPALISQGGIEVGGTGAGATSLIRSGSTLGPQTVYQWNVGLNFAPADGFLAGLNVDVTYFQLRFEDLITGRGNVGGGVNDPLARDRFTVIPNPAAPITDPSNAAFFELVNQIAAFPVRGGQNPLNATTIPNVRFIEDTALFNIGWRELRGIDFDARYDWDLGNWGAWHVGASGYYEVDQRQQAAPGGEIEEIYEGRHSGNRLKRARYRLGWTDSVWSVTAFANYRGHGQFNVDSARIIPSCYYDADFGPGNPTSTAFGGLCYPNAPFHGPFETYPSYSPATVTMDLTFGYDTLEAPANPYLRNISFQLAINNILDRKPPFQVGARNSLRDLRAFDNTYNELGRVVNFTVTKSW